jgi:hypothetical protein
VTISYADIRKAMGGKPYPMSLSEPEAKWVVEAVNKGIDAHLEACFSPDLGDSYEVAPRMVGEVSLGNYLNCEVSPESLPTLLRRLEELDGETEWDDSSGSPICLVDAILQTLGFNDRGELVGTEEE